jgi:hypothetical protein
MIDIGSGPLVGADARMGIGLGMEFITRLAAVLPGRVGIGVIAAWKGCGRPACRQIDAAAGAAARHADRWATAARTAATRSPAATSVALGESRSG